MEHIVQVSKRKQSVSSSIKPYE